MDIPCVNVDGFLASHLPSYERVKKVMMTAEPLNAFVIGSTGVGKSSLLSMLVQPDKPNTFKSAGQTAAVTQEVSSHLYCHESALWLENDTIRQYNVNLIDSPGLNDAAERGVDLQHVYNLVEEIKNVKKLHSLLFVGKLGRFDVQFTNTLKYCCSELFSSVPDHFIKIVLTHLDEDTFLDFKESPEDFEKRMMDIRQQISDIVGKNSRAIRVYLVFTGRRRGIQSQNIKKYIDYFRNNTDLTPGSICKDEWDVENLDFHTLYFRDRLIYDIFNDTAHFNWKKSSVVIPPSILPLKTEALKNLYKKKVELTASMPEAFKLTEEINGLNRQRGRLDDEICRLSNDHKPISGHRESYYGVLADLRRVKVLLSGTPRGSVVFFHDNSNGIQVSGVSVVWEEKEKDSYAHADISFKITGFRGILDLDFYIPGEAFYCKEIEGKRAEIVQIKTQLMELQKQLDAAPKVAKKLKKIDRSIKKLERSHVRMADLELIYSLI